MCSIDWALLREWVGTLAELATAILAGLAFLAWRSHLRGTTEYRVAHKVVEQARLLRYFFYDARNPWVDAGEFPAGYHTVAGQRSTTQEADGLAHVYDERYNLVARQVWVLARLRARAGAVLGDDVAKLIEDLARKARELHGFMREKVAQVRAGESIARQWPNQEWNARVRASVTASPDDHSDQFSREFEEKLAALEARLRQYK